MSKFKYERGQQLTKPGVHGQRSDWLKGLHCQVVNRVYDVDVSMEYYLVHEYLETDVQPEGEKRLIGRSQLEDEYVPWNGYDAWNAMYPT